MGKFSKDKGKRGERELVNFLKAQGIPAERTAQHSGKDGGPADLILPDHPDWHIECKRVEALSLYGALGQAATDAQNSNKKAQIPAVFHRRNNQPWVMIVFADLGAKLIQYHDLCAREFEL